MKTTKLLILICAISLNTVYAQENNVNDNTHTVDKSYLELPRIQVIPIEDTKNDRQYELYVKLPEGYSENNNKKYPVLYFTDAMWHIEILSASTEYMLEDVILVGISWQKDINEDLKKEKGEYVSRFRDYSFRKSDKPEIQTKLQLGQANKHLDFIRNGVITYVDNTFRTDPDSRTYFGYSLGGEFGAYILLKQPDTFDNYILGSPSIKNDISYLSEFYSELKSTESYKNSELRVNVFIAHGSLEEDQVEPVKEFVDLLDSNLRISIQSEVIEGDHQSAFPMTAVRSVAWLSTLIRGVVSSDAEIALNRAFYTPEFLTIPILNKAFINTTPEDRSDGIAVGELGVDDGNKDLIVKLAQEIADHKLGRFDSFLITHKDKLIFESYYARGRINQHHAQASATKAYTSLLLGRAIQLGYLSMDDLDKPLTHFLKELDPTKFVEGAETITLNHALTMRSGIRISEKQREEMNKNPDQLKGQGRVQALLEHSAPITKESQVFKYGIGPVLVMQVIEAVVPGSAMDFIKKELLDKMGITDYIWNVNPQSGLPESGWSVSITSRAMVKLGILARNKGKWKGKQLIPEVYIDRAIHRIVRQSDDRNFADDGNITNTGYGYLWWQADMKAGNKNYFSTAARGGAGQYIILIEELDLMIVFTGHDNDPDYLQITAERILPAFIKEY